MRHFLFYLMALALCLPAASCSDEFVELPYAYEANWNEYDLDIPQDTVTYIESQDEFNRLFADAESKPEASVPFDDAVLVIAKGISSYGIADFRKELIPSGSRYRLSVQIRQALTPVMQTWYAAYVIPKAYVGKVDLEVEYKCQEEN